MRNPGAVARVAAAEPDLELVGAGISAAVRSALSERPAVLDQLVRRIRTGCVYEVQPADTFGVLVTRDDPRMRWRAQKARRVLAPIDTHWSTFAPSVFLLTGHETACRTRRCRGIGRCDGHAPLQLGWPAFAAAYCAELEHQPFLARLAVIRQVVGWLQAASTITILSFERGKPEPSASDGAETAVGNWAQRHVFRDWLVSLLPLAIPLMTLPEAGSRQ